jgi:serine/threonine protein kinase
VEPLRGADPVVVGRYRLLSRLGSGGMGVVYLADGPRGRVAMKVVRAELGDNATFRARFRREVQASFRVSSAYTAKLLDFDTEADQPWLATEFVDGPSLEELVTTGGPLSHADQLTLAAGLAQALTAVHAEHLVHRDLKPPNVLMTASGPIVIDFGIAAAADVARLTTEGLMVGSPGWLAPEQLEIGEAVPASDVFALGLVLCFAASGEQPFGQGSNPALISRALTSSPAIPLERLAPGLHDLVLASVRRDPQERPTAEELVARLSNPGPAPTLVEERETQQQTVIQHRTTAPVPPAPLPPAPLPPAPLPPLPPTPPQTTPLPAPLSPKRRRGPVAAVVGALVVAGAAVGLIVGLGGSSPSAGAPPSPTPTPTPAPSSSDPRAQQALLASAATLQVDDFPGGVQPDNSVFTLPCDLKVVDDFSDDAVHQSVKSPGSGTLTGDYVQEEVRALPTQSDAVAFFNRVRAEIGRCPAGRFTNDSGSAAARPLSLGIGDQSIYVAEKAMGAGGSSAPATESWAAVRRGSVVFRVFVQYLNRGNRSQTTDLLRTLVSRIDAAH